MNETKVKNEIETFLKSGMVFEYVLKKNPGLYFHWIQSIRYQDYWFEYCEDNIVFIGDQILNETTNSHGDLFYQYISDFVFTGKLCYSDNTPIEHKLDILINATVRIFKQPSFEIDITEKSNNVEVWDSNQKLTNLIQIQSQKKLEGIKMLPYDYGIYTQVWAKLDKSLNYYNKQTHVTSYYYLQELIESYERIKHLLSIVLVNVAYSNNYTTRKTELPQNYNTPYLFKIDENFHIYDRYFLLYSELTIESLYKFWERVGFYLFQFLRPISNKINDHNLSLFKLVFELNKECSNNPYLKNAHFDWFKEFVLKDKSDFKQLQEFRHPLVHYKIDDSAGKEFGSIISTVLNLWSKNMTDELFLKNLENENKKIKDFLLNQFEKCEIGYNHMIGIISLLPDKN